MMFSPINFLSILMVTYLPTILMNMINQATNYINTETKGGSHLILPLFFLNKNEVKKTLWI